MSKIVNLQDYKDYYGINDTEDAAQIELSTRAAHDFIEAYCGRTFLDHYSDAKTEWYDAGEAVILLEGFPLVEVTSVKTSKDGGVTQETLAENTDYFVNFRDTTIESASGGPFLRSYQTAINSLVVEFKFGYEQAPDDLKLAAILLTKYFVKNEHTPSASFGATTVDNPVFEGVSLPAHIKRILNLYRV